MARIAQTGHLKHRFVSNSEQRAPWQGEEIDASRGDVFSELSRTNAKTLRVQLVEQLGVDQVNLTKVRLVGVNPDAGPVLDKRPLMPIALDAEAGHDFDCGRRLLRKAMFAISRDGNDSSGTHLVRRLASVLGPAALSWNGALNATKGNLLTFGGRRYRLLQFHFRHPSEHRIRGKNFQMEAHFVHAHASGALAVLGILLVA